MLGVDLVGDEAVPEDPRHGAEERPGVRPERARLDQRDARPATEVGRPVERVVSSSAIRRNRSGLGALAGRRPASKSRWNADAVGSDWPWYLEPSSLLPYGRSTGLDIRKKLIWPIFMPK